MSGRKKIAWLDTVRVFSAFMVIVGHYVSCFDEFADFNRMRLFFFHAGNVGVFLFFVLSGYLIPASLERKSSLWNFYKRKLIRVVIPFVVAYFVFGFALMLFGLIQPSSAFFSPFYRAAYESGFSLGKIISIFPVDVNLVRFLGLPLEWFVGEWFMGVLLWLYLISPLLDKLVRRAPLVTLIVSIAISIGTFYFSEVFVAQGRVLTGWWLFPARIPEFLFGMMLFIYKDFIERNRRKIFLAALIWSVAVGAFEIVKYPEIPAILTRLYPLEPRSMLMTLPTSYLLFVFTERLNEIFPLALGKFNSFSDVSYMAMLTQHIILYIFAAQFHVQDLRTVGLILVFFLATATIIYVSAWVKKFSDPAEKIFPK